MPAAMMNAEGKACRGSNVGVGVDWSVELDGELGGEEEERNSSPAGVTVLGSAFMGKTEAKQETAIKLRTSRRGVNLFIFHHFLMAGFLNKSSFVKFS
jgi:hypothetical protein